MIFTAAPFTTPTFLCELESESVDLTQAAHVYATITQGCVELTKSDGELVVTADTVAITLTQEEAGRFATGSAKIQINWTYPDGSRPHTAVAVVLFGEQLCRRVLP